MLPSVSLHTVLCRHTGNCYAFPLPDQLAPVVSRSASVLGASPVLVRHYSESPEVAAGDEEEIAAAAARRKIRKRRRRRTS